MRVIAGVGLACQPVLALKGSISIKPVIVELFEIALGLLLFVGLWTPIAGVLAAAIELWGMFSKPGDFCVTILLGSMGLALALIGPGAFSVDARRFGWKRVDIRDRKP